MYCENCGSKIVEGNSFCINCGTPVQPINQNGQVSAINSTETSAPLPIHQNGNIKKGKTNLLPIIILVVIVCIIGGVIIFNNKGKTQRSKILMQLDNNDNLKFTIGEQDFYLGDSLKEYQEKGYTYEDDYLDDEDRISKDAIAIHTIYNDDNALFLGALYCPKTSDCPYDESILVKANFYEDADVVINDFIKIGTSYDDIVEKYGKEDGTFYQDDHLLVWTFGEKGKIGEPYYILNFDSGWFYGKKVSEIRIGVWWYDGEYEHTVIHEEGE